MSELRRAHRSIEMIRARTGREKVGTHESVYQVEKKKF